MSRTDVSVCVEDRPANRSVAHRFGSTTSRVPIHMLWFRVRRPATCRGKQQGRDVGWCRNSWPAAGASRWTVYNEFHSRPGGRALKVERSGQG